MRSLVADLLADLAAALREQRMRWYLFGAQAAIIYGVARLTADVDVTVLAPSDVSVSEWLPAIERRGFHRRFEDAQFALHTRVLPLVHETSGLPVDIVLAGPGLEEDILGRAEMHDIDSVTVPVIAVSDLVILKVLAGRPKDLEDVRTLLRVQGTRIDLTHVRHVLGLLEEALGQSDLIAALEHAQARTRG